MKLILRYSIRGACIIFWVLVSVGLLFVPRVRTLFPARKSISILVWPTDVDQQALQQFEHETGVTVNVSYFEDYEEFFVKLRATKGEGYDLVAPADYIVPALVRQGLLKKLDKKKLTFLSDINPDLTGLYYDPDNTYTVPYFWGMFGLGFNKAYFKGKQPPATWGLLFDPILAPASVAMVQDAREVTMVAAQYLFGSFDTLTDAQVQEVKQLLVEQKTRVRLYTDMRAASVLASGSCPVALTISYEVARAMQQYPEIDFLIPQEGGFLIIDNFAIPAASTKSDLAYTFLNFLYRPEVVREFVRKQLFYPPTKQVVSKELFANVSLPTAKQLKQATFFKEAVTEEQLNAIWIALKG